MISTNMVFIISHQSYTCTQTDKILNAFNYNPKSIQRVGTILNTSNYWCVCTAPLLTVVDSRYGLLFSSYFFYLKVQLLICFYYYYYYIGFYYYCCCYYFFLLPAILKGKKNNMRKRTPHVQRWKGQWSVRV